MGEEKWLPVVGFEGLYEISDLGRVKSLRYKGKNEIGYLTPTLMKNGYLVVMLSGKNKRVLKYVHHLVAESFMGHIKKSRMIVINHRNLIKTDNRLDNFNIITQRDNSDQRHLPSSSNYVGVSWNKKLNKWISKINIKSKKIYLGAFDLEIEAHNAYQEKLKEINNFLKTEGVIL
jgi:hypothetical protein